MINLKGEISIGKVGKEQYFAWYAGKKHHGDKYWQTFKEHIEDMGIRPKGKALLRKDESKRFCKENCYWGSLSKYRHKKKRLFDGKGLNEWARFLGVSRGCVQGRIRKYGSMELAIKSFDKYILAKQK